MATALSSAPQDERQSTTLLTKFSSGQKQVGSAVSVQLVMKIQVLRHLGRTSGHSVDGIVTAGIAALLVVVKIASIVELPDPLMIGLSAATVVLPTRPIWVPLELLAVSEVITVETTVDVAMAVDVRALSVTRYAEPVTTGIV